MAASLDTFAACCCGACRSQGLRAFELNTGGFAGVDRHVPTEATAAVPDEVLERFAEGFEARSDVVAGQLVSPCMVWRSTQARRQKSEHLVWAMAPQWLPPVDLRHAVLCDCLVCVPSIVWCAFQGLHFTLLHVTNTVCGCPFPVQCLAFITPFGSKLSGAAPAGRLVREKVPFFLADYWNRCVIAPADATQTTRLAHGSTAWGRLCLGGWCSCPNSLLQGAGAASSAAQ